MFLCSGRMIQVLVLTLSAVASVWASPLSQERFQVTTFGAERRARWSLDGKTAIVTGGTKVLYTVAKTNVCSSSRRVVLQQYIYLTLCDFGIFGEDNMPPELSSTPTSSCFFAVWSQPSL